MVNTPTGAQQLEIALVAIPEEIRTVAIREYVKAKRQFLISDYEHSALAIGKFAEFGLRAVQQLVLGKYVLVGDEIKNFLDACQEIERAPKASAPESLRIIVPRALAFVYTLRNKRGFGHATGGLDPRQMDVGAAMRVVDWIVAELVSASKSIPLEEAQTLVDALAIREVPMVWSTGGTRRVLAPGLRVADQTLLLLYSATEEAVPVEDLCSWVEYDTVGHYKRDVLQGLHSRRLVNLDPETQTVVLTPKGSRDVQSRVLPQIQH